MEKAHEEPGARGAGGGGGGDGSREVEGDYKTARGCWLAR